MLFAAADAALYDAKRAGRNAVSAGSSDANRRRELMLECFVGRAAERAQLRGLLDAAAQGRPHVVAVYGEAGVGKSTLVKQLAPEVGIRAGSLLTGRCVEADVRAPYAPWVDVVVGALRAGIAPKHPWRELVRLVPELAGGADTTRRDTGSPHALVEELELFLREASEARPLVIMLDDMQWADTATWDALEYLVGRLDSQRILICLTIRIEDLDATGNARRGRLSRADCYSEVPLGRLTEAELGQWLRTALGGQEPAPALFSYLVAQSEGNSFFVLQTLRALVEDERLTFIDGGWIFDAGGDGSMPRAIHDLLARRVARLDRRRRDVLATAAVLGASSSPRRWSRRATATRTRCSTRSTRGSRPRCSCRRTSRRRRSPSRTRCSRACCRTASIRCACGASTSGWDARSSRARATPRPKWRCTSTAPGAPLTRTEPRWRPARAPPRSTRTSRLPTCSPSHSAMRERFPEMADVEWRTAQIAEIRGRVSDAERACDAVLTTFASGAAELGVLRAARRMRERLRLHRGAPAAQVADACGALLADARAAGADEEIVPLLIMISTAHGRLGDGSAAARIAREASDEAARLHNLPLEADAAMRLGSTEVGASPADAVPHYRRALDIFTRLENRYGQLRSHINIGVAYDRAGNSPGAEVSYAMALSIGRDIRATDLTGIASLNLGVLLLKTGRFDRAQERFDEARELFTTIANEPFRLAALYNLANVARERGDPAGALELYAASVALAETLGHADVHAGALAGAGLAELDLGAVRGARAHQDAVGALIAGRTDVWFEGRELCEALCIRLAAHDGSDPAVVDLLLGALDRAERHNQYAAIWLGAECAAVLRTAGPVAEASLHRYLVHARALGYEPLIARLRGNG